MTIAKWQYVVIVSAFLVLGLCTAPTAWGDGQCAPVNTTQWDALINFAPSQSVQQAAAANGWTLQPLDTGASDVVNLDDYEVTISKLPTVGGHQLSPAEFLESVRLNLNTFLDPSLGTFYAVDANNQQKWATGTVGAEMVFNIVIPTIPGHPLVSRAGEVILSDRGDLYWRFSTAHDQHTAPHPVSGVREFGLRTLPGGQYAFYTRGVDRISNTLDDTFFEKAIFDGGNAIWSAVQDRLADFVYNHQGHVSSINRPIVNRPCVQDVNGVSSRPSKIDGLSGICVSEDAACNLAHSQWDGCVKAHGDTSWLGACTPLIKAEVSSCQQAAFDCARTLGSLAPVAVPPPGKSVWQGQVNANSQPNGFGISHSVAASGEPEFFVGKTTNSFDIYGVVVESGVLPGKEPETFFNTFTYYFENRVPKEGEWSTQDQSFIGTYDLASHPNYGIITYGSNQGPKAGGTFQGSINDQDTQWAVLPPLKGTITTKDGQTFTGDFANGKPSDGKITWNNGNSFSGTLYQNGALEDGTLVIKDGPAFVHCQWSGCQEPHGRVEFDGHFSANGEFAHGRLTYADNVIYDGDFDARGQPSNGQLHWPSGKLDSVSNGTYQGSTVPPVGSGPSGGSITIGGSSSSNIGGWISPMP